MTDKKPKGWQPGQSGNPRGKKPGCGALQKLRATLAPDVPDILAGLVTAAKGGDVQAARLILERALPALKASEATQPIDLPTGSLTDQGRAVLAAVAAGELAPGQAAQLLTAISGMAKIVEIDELAQRVQALEANHVSRT